MKPGDRVWFVDEQQRAIGRVLGIQIFLNAEYAEIVLEKTGQKIVVSAGDLELYDHLDDRLADDAQGSSSDFLFRLTVEWALQTSQKSALKTPGNFKILPLPHQLLTVQFVIDQFKPRVLIADEVGLGKTVEAALVYEELKARSMVKRVLIIAPSALCLQWREELREKFQEEFTIYNRETVSSLKQLYGQATNVWTLSDRIITSLDFIKPKKLYDDLSLNIKKNREWHNREVADAAADSNFDLVIFDEAHKLTKDKDDTESARYKIGKRLTDSVPMLLLLSATPHQGDSSRFRNLLHLIDPLTFNRNSQVTPNNVKRVTVRNHKRAVVDFNGNRLFKQRLVLLYVIEWDPERDKIEIELYQAVTEYVQKFYELAASQKNLVMMFLLLVYQRMVSSSSKALLKSLSRRLEMLEASSNEPLATQPEEDLEIENDEWTDFGGQDQWEELQGRVRLKSETNQEIHMLRNCVDIARKAAFGRNDAKLVRLLSLVDEFRSQENEPTLKFIIFTEFRETQFYLVETLERLGYSAAVIHGGISVPERIKQVEKFRDEAQFLVSTDAGGEGINLQFCRILINYDLPWNPMKLEQRIGRIDRIGQQYDVKVINFQLADTVEQRVREVIEQKLHTVRLEFQDGENKLTDILSTLEDQFSFENLYVHALLKREKEAVKLEELAQKLMKKAKRIIEEQELALPVSNLEDVYSVSEQDVQHGAVICRLLLERYLATGEEKLIEDRQQPGVFSFRDPNSGKRYGKVAFDPRLTMEDNSVEHFTLQNGLIRDILLSELKPKVARLYLTDRRFIGERGFLFVYRLTVSNNIDIADRHLLTSFVSVSGEQPRVHQRLTQYFSNVSSVVVDDMVRKSVPNLTAEIRTVGENHIWKKAESIFYEICERQAAALEDEKLRFSQYVSDRQNAVSRLPLENVRRAKEREINADLDRKQHEFKRRQKLSPFLELVQTAYVECRQNETMV